MKEHLRIFRASNKSVNRGNLRLLNCEKFSQVSTWLIRMTLFWSGQKSGSLKIGAVQLFIRTLKLLHELKTLVFWSH